MATEVVGLKVSMEKPAAWARRLTITVPAEQIAREKKEAVQRLAKRVRLPGFRQGRVPAGVMEKKFGPAIEQEAIEKVIGDAYRQALESGGLQPITQGNIDNIEYEPGTDLTFNVELEVRPEVELERVGGFAVMREEPVIGDEQVDEVLQRLQSEHAVWKPKEEGTPVGGDMATVEITPLDEPTGAEPAQPRSYQIVIGEGQALPAVEDAIRTLTGARRASSTSSFRRTRRIRRADGAAPDAHPAAGGEDAGAARPGRRVRPRPRRLRGSGCAARAGARGPAAGSDAGGGSRGAHAARAADHRSEPVRGAAVDGAELPRARDAGT
jgi:trigger factor